jgi:hypothetical protein
MDRRSLSRTGRIAAVLGTALLLAGPGDAVASNSLATPITGRQVRELWPIEIAAEIVKVRPSDQERGSARLRAGIVPLRASTMQVADGHHMRFSSVVRTTRGLRRFELSVVPRHHPDAIELEWDLEVHDAPYAKIDVGQYLLHRLRVARELELEEEHLKIVRSDIVETRTEPYVHRFRVDEDVYEIRILARGLRG